ncbi:MAG: hypothetical protein IJ264_06150, partial [Clostridia bacterium]|nr:hypothetical protein [Clostridia bacterium]
MKKRNSGLLKESAIFGAVAGSVCAAVAGVFIEKFMSKNGIKSIIASNNLMPAGDSDCFYESEEALAGIEFYRKMPCEEISVINKYGKTLYADFYKAETESDIYAISCHGFTGIPSQNNIYAKRFYEMGYN